MERVEDILKMIETVDPNDMAKLDEIDARVYDYICENHKLEVIRSVKAFFLRNCGNFEDFINSIIKKEIAPKYTRSRNALKAIRPEGWVFEVCYELNELGSSYYCPAYRYNGEFWLASNDIGEMFTDMWSGPTEELAELHAILQAIAYERSQNER